MKVLQRALKFCANCQPMNRFAASIYVKKYSTAGIGLDDDLLGFSDEQKEVGVFKILIFVTIKIFVIVGIC